MDGKLRERCELFDENNRILREKYWFQWQSIQLVASAMLTMKEEHADTEKMQACRKTLKQYFGVLSNMRGHVELPILANMAMQQDADGYAQSLKSAYDALAKGRAFRTEFDALCAMLLADHAGSIDFSGTAEKIRGIYRSMRENHPLLTSRADMASAAMFALADREPDALLDDMEACYRYLKPHFFMRGDQVQTMSALLAVMDGSVEDKCERTLALCDALKKRRLSLNYSMTLPIVAGLAGVSKPMEEIVGAVEEIADWLKGKKGFGVLGQGKKGRITYAMMLYLGNCAQEGGLDGTLLQSTLTSIIILEIIVMMYIVMTASVHASSSSSSK